MISKSDKEKLFQDYTKIFNNLTVGILIETNKLTVSEVTELRKRLTTEQSFFKILKNRVAIKAAQGNIFESLSADMKETRAIMYSFEDGLKAVKILTQEAKKSDKLKVVSGLIVSGEKSQILDPAAIEELGNLPSREELIAKLLYVLNAPVTGIAVTLNEIPASFVRTLQAIAESKQAA